MSWYQLVSLFAAFYCAFNWLPIVAAIAANSVLTISLQFRIFQTVIWVNLVMAFVGVPW